MNDPNNWDDEISDREEEIAQETAGAKHVHTKGEFDAHANDLEKLDVGGLLEDAVEFFGEPAAHGTQASKRPK